MFIQHLLILKYVVSSFDTKRVIKMKQTFELFLVMVKEMRDAYKYLSWSMDCSEQVFTRAL